MRQSRTSGSVGAPGERSPGATRPKLLGDVVERRARAVLLRAVRRSVGIGEVPGQVAHRHLPGEPGRPRRGGDHGTDGRRDAPGRGRRVTEGSFRSIRRVPAPRPTRGRRTRTGTGPFPAVHRHRHPAALPVPSSLSNRDPHRAPAERPHGLQLGGSDGGPALTEPPERLAPGSMSSDRARDAVHLRKRRSSCGDGTGRCRRGPTASQRNMGACTFGFIQRSWYRAPSGSVRREPGATDRATASR